MESIPILNKAFGQLLREHRLKRSISQEELAFKADLHRTYISLLERGLKTPTLSTLFQLCKSLEIEPDYFVAELNEKLAILSENQVE